MIDVIKSLLYVQEGHEKALPLGAGSIPLKEEEESLKMSGPTRKETPLFYGYFKIEYTPYFIIHHAQQNTASC